MADPTKDKTWEYDLNNLVIADGATVDGAFLSTRQRLFGIKEILINNGSTTFTAPWTVVSSSDSSTSGASDLWVDEFDLVWADDDTSNARSWIVLRQTGISTTFEVCIVCQEDSTSNDGKQIEVWVAQAGFTGGSTTARPTATDERQLRDSTADGYWGSGQVNTAYTSQTHVWMSSDGDCTRIVICIGDVVTGYWAFETPKNPTTGWTDPYFACIEGEANVTTSQVTYSRFLDNATMRGRYSGANTTMYLSSEGMVNDGIGEATGNGTQQQNQLDNSYIASQCGLSSTTSTFVGRHGEVFDMWWGLSFVGTGRYYPETGTKAFVQIGDFVFPWDGSTLIRTR